VIVDDSNGNFARAWPSFDKFEKFEKLNLNF